MGFGELVIGNWSLDKESEIISSVFFLEMPLRGRSLLRALGFVNQKFKIITLSATPING
jgi:hypothetical protein